MMRFSSKLELASEYYLKERKKLILVVILYMMLTVFMTIMFFLIEQNYRLHYEADGIYKGDLDCIGAYSVWSLQNDGEEDVEHFREIKTYLEEKGFHLMSCYVAYYPAQLATRFKEIQGSHFLHESPLADVENEFEMITCSASMFDVYQLALSEGTLAFETEEPVIYLGSAYRGAFQTGEVYNGDTIGGFLEDGSSILDASLVDFTGSELSVGLSLDYAILKVYPNMFDTQGVFSCESNVELENAREFARNFADKTGFFIRFTTYDEVFTRIERENAVYEGILWQILVSVGIAIIGIFLSVQVMTIITKQREYGIWYANGATTTELTQIMLMQNIFVAVLSLVMSVPLLLFLIRIVFQTDVLGGYAQTVVFVVKYTAWKVILIDLLIAGLASVIPILIFRKQSPVSMLGGLRE